ncbi:MAG TPA: hypothetical protein PK950_02120 [Candidatus Paceibacterota bacterium]|nr:hypothetical protein [Candidatus Paceibacterota bacterium]
MDTLFGRYLQTCRHLSKLHKLHSGAIEKFQFVGNGVTSAASTVDYLDYKSIMKKMVMIEKHVASMDSHNKLMEALEYIIYPTIAHRPDLEINLSDRQSFEAGITNNFISQHEQSSEKIKKSYAAIHATYFSNKLRYENIVRSADHAEYFLKQAIEATTLASIKKKIETIKSWYGEIKTLPDDYIFDPKLFLAKIIEERPNQAITSTKDFEQVQFENKIEEAIVEAWKDAEGLAVRNFLPKELNEARNRFKESFSPDSREKYEEKKVEDKAEIASFTSSYILRIAKWYYEYQGVIAQEIKLIEKRKATANRSEASRDSAAYSTAT